MDHRKMLIAMMAAFFVLWVVIPLILPGAGYAIAMATLPFRLLGVFVHEMGHGLFTLLSGGRFLWFQMDTTGGVAVTSGGFRIFTLLGGLLAPALCGAVLLQASTRARSMKWSLWSLTAFFVIGMIYMIKPIFIGWGQGWSPIYLVSMILPGAAAFITVKIIKMSDTIQRGWVQFLGILMCYSGFSDTHYIFRYEPLPNNMFSDARAFAGLFWTGPENVPYLIFLIAAIFISVLNIGLMAWGVHRAFKTGNTINSGRLPG